MKLTDAIRIARRTLAETGCIELAGDKMRAVDPHSFRDDEMQAAYDVLASFHASKVCREGWDL